MIMSSHHYLAVTAALLLIYANGNGCTNATTTITTNQSSLSSLINSNNQQTNLNITSSPSANSQQPAMADISSSLNSSNNNNNGDSDEQDIMTAEKGQEPTSPNGNKGTEDTHTFYKPEYISNNTRAMSYWLDFSKLNVQNSTKHDMLSKSHRRAAPIKLTFDFPYYGQPLRNIIIATGGFLYVGEHLHHWLAATQNISPLMANFDLSTSNDSDIHYYDDGKSLTVQWQNVQMKDHKPEGNFSFQVTLNKTGDIIFVYKHLPVSIDKIPEDEHPVKVGISDAFLVDKVVFFIRRKTIYDYHRINLKENFEITNQTAIILKALPTCNQYDSCETCSKANSTLGCIWCPTVNRCSNGFDRKRQEWLQNHCDILKSTDCSAKAEPSATVKISGSQAQGE